MSRMAEYRSSMTAQISRRCGCTQEQSYYFRHKCVLKVVNLDTIDQWFFAPEEIQNYTAKLYVAEIMMQSLLDPTYDYLSSIQKAEQVYGIDLTGLSLIIDDYRRWYIINDKESPLRVAPIQQKTISEVSDPYSKGRPSQQSSDNGCTIC